MYFQVSISPKLKEEKKRITVPEEDTSVLKLAPFTKIPKLCFENVFIGQTASQTLKIENPNAWTSKLKLIKLPPADRNLSLNWCETEIIPNGETDLLLSWTPAEAGSWRDSIHILDNRNVKRDIPIVFTSISKKVKRGITTKTRTKATVLAKTAINPISKKLRSSPKDNKRKCSPLKANGNNILLNSPGYNKKSTPAKKRSQVLKSNKENSSSLYFSNNETVNKDNFTERLANSFFFSPTESVFKSDEFSPLNIRRETYAIGTNIETDTRIFSPTQIDEVFNDSLELEKENASYVCTIPADKPNNLGQLLSSESFMFSPVSKNKPNIPALILSNTFEKKLLDLSESNLQSTTIINFENTALLHNDNELFLPNNCSTEMKKTEKTSLQNLSTPKVLFKPNSTYELLPDIKNISSETYNMSHDTCTLGNTSSASTYSILSPEFKDNIKQALSFGDNLASHIRTSSPVSSLHSTDILQNKENFTFNFSGVNAKLALSAITEEESNFDFSIRSIQNASSTINVNAVKRKSEIQPDIFTISPPKRAFIKPRGAVPKKLNTTCNKKPTNLDRYKKKHISVQGLSLNLRKEQSSRNVQDVSVSTVNNSCNIDPFLIAAIYSNDTTIESNSNLDPFISSTLYYDELCLEKQTVELKKWLNALLSPPSELDSKAETKQVDVAKLYQECVKKELVYAPTKEKISSNYHTNYKLDALRSRAKQLFLSSEMRTVLSKISVIVENKQLAIRDDKNLHLDVGLQSQIITLLLCYNPLWLRIGLETIYNQIIPLESNSDVIGLSKFIIVRFINCPEMEQKSKIPSHSKYFSQYAVSVKKFTLKKFLMLIYFLDQAKTQKLIAHDPCLFCKDSSVKESREILLSFSRELLSSVGDVTKFLRRFNYELSQKQNFIDEFDYAVKHLGIDLRDGIRLTKVMEIILIRHDLTAQLRGPAISRLQKIHNVKLALDSLEEAGYKIAGDITPKDIVDGHREKTLSLLWQIIYKFQAPRFTNAASKIQTWWRSLKIVIKRRQLDRPYQRRIQSALIIQRFYKSVKLMRIERATYFKKRAAIITIQRFVKSVIFRKKYLQIRCSVIVIQRTYRAFKMMKDARQYYLNLKVNVILIQRHFRALLERKKYREVVVKLQRIFRAKQIMKKDRKTFIEKKQSVLVIQKYFQANLLMKATRKIFLQKKYACIAIQRYFRAYLLAKQERNNYLQMKSCAVKIQEKFRAYILMKRERQEFLMKKTAVSTIQTHVRYWLIMKKQRSQYLTIKKSVLIIQRKFRANLLMKTERRNYIHQLKAIICIQQYFKSYSLMKKERDDYLKQRNTIISIQQRFRANLEMKKTRYLFLQKRNVVIIIQTQLRAYLVRQNYLRMKNATIIIQRKLKATLLMEKTREDYVCLRKATITLQQHFRAYNNMINARQQYIKYKNSAIIIQRRFRAYLEKKIVNEQYRQLKKFTIIIQQRFRANLLMKETRRDYLNKNYAVIKIQRKFRANIIMKQMRADYLNRKKIVIRLQQRIRANLIMKEIRETYLMKKDATIKIQRRFRAYIQMKITRDEYQNLKMSVIFMQRQIRANLLMKKVRHHYLKQKVAAIIIQRKWRATIVMKKDHQNYILLKKSTVLIQQQFRAITAMKIDRLQYLKQRHAAITIQQRFRANICMKNISKDYIKKRNAVLTIQRRLRSYIAMKKIRENYLKQRNAALTIQRQFRAYMKMKNCRENYRKQQSAILLIQRKFRAHKEMKKLRQDYLKMKNATTVLQQRYRAIKEMKIVRENYLKLRTTTITIQSIFKAKVCRNSYKKQLQTVIYIQRKFRAKMAMRKMREEYVKLKYATNIIQQRFRAKIIRKNYLELKRAVTAFQSYFRAKIARENYIKQRNAAVYIQQKFRAHIKMKLIHENYLKLKKATIVLQQRFRAYKQMKSDREQYLYLKQVTIIVQQQFRANLIMKKYLKLKTSVIFVQSYYRSKLKMRIVRENYLKLKQTTITLQQRFRAYIALKKQREYYLTVRKSTITIQRWFRSIIEMKISRQYYLTQKHSVYVIQRHFRSYLQMKQDRSKYFKMKLSAVIIQKHFRVFIMKKRIRREQAAILIQSIVRRFLAKKLIERLQEKARITKEQEEQRKISRAAIKIQAAWRGHKVRSTEEQKITRIREKCKEINSQAVPEQTLGQRSREAIELLIVSQSMRDIISALSVLDFATRLFPNICMDLCDQIVEKIFLFLAYSNRSVPDTEVCILGINVLINLYKYKSTFFAVWKTDYVEVLLSLLLHWSNKDGVLFPNACTFLWLLAQNPENCKVIMSINNAVKILTRTYHQCERKQKMFSRMRNNLNNRNASKVCLVPSLTPDWGIINKKSPYVFINPVFAMQCLFKILGIQIY